MLLRVLQDDMLLKLFLMLLLLLEEVVMLLLLYKHCRSVAVAAQRGDVHRSRRSHCSTRHGHSVCN